MSKYFTYEERLRIQLYLKECRSFREIAKLLEKDPSTISREVRKYQTEVATGYPGFPYNTCKHRFSCNTITKVEVWIQNLHLGYKSCIWFSKMASGLTNWHLVLQFSLWQLIELPCIMYKDKYILINNKVCAIF